MVGLDSNKMHVLVRGANPWLDKHVETFIKGHVPGAVFVDDLDEIPQNATTTFQFCDGYNLNPHFGLLNASDTSMMNAYPNSDALSRKDYLGKTIEYWAAKRPRSTLREHVPRTVHLSLDYSEYVDEALAAADDLSLLSSLEDNEDKPASEREWWILKPALIDCGFGIRIFSTVDELASHLELAAEIDEEEEDEVNGFSPSLSAPYLSSLDALVTATGKITVGGSKWQTTSQPFVISENDRIPSAQMREFVAQRYIVSVPPLDTKKWHARAYVLSVGRLKVHVFREMLALLALKEYEPPWENPSILSSLTNTSLQDEDEFVSNGSMREFWEIPDDLLPGDWKRSVFDQICDISAELFQAAAHTMADKFTPLDKCFELFAVDCLIDTSGRAWLLEVNETPAFYENGYAGELAMRLMESVICVAMEHMGRVEVGDARSNVARERMVEVLDETEKLGKSNITEILPER
ncbi:tubulin-tyrosine ligase family-domain-containing protein [Thelonectria olida]|uniref:Tubulin-tyrosine ligase family-domain-containing protein n=1 Tax=Thelonectria olida TaxID=1576542 RepID=A0A9P8W4Q9_9HYPO|nr:tubulin-tyrosine ligase family-domain-containing protein [Thelonectria olida]